MDITELGAIGELVSGVAVVGSLIYVGLQVRQSNRIAQSSAVRSGRAAAVDMLRTWFNDPTGVTVYLEGLRDRHALRTEDRVKFDMMLNQVFRTLESMFYEHRDGHLGQELWMSFEREAEPVFAQPGAVNWWFERHTMLTPTFARYVEERFLADLPAESA